MRIRMIVQYDGSDFAGWQAQAGLRTVQGVLESALQKILGAAVRIHGAGRTDAGVHAVGQVAHLDVEGGPPPARLPLALNRALPPDVRVVGANVAPEGFHARKSAVFKEYRYTVVQGPVMPPFRYRFALLVRGPLDVAAMQASAKLLEGTHDFAALSALGSSATTSVRTVRLSEWRESGDDLVYVVRADGFLYKMVRILAGTLLEVGRGRRTADSVSVLLAAPDRSAAGPAAPARGLCLERVVYPPET